MGLNHPTDLEAWQRWQHGQHHLSRRLRSAVSRSADSRAVLWKSADTPTVIAVVDALTPTARASLIEPLRRVTAPIGVLLPLGTDPGIPGLVPTRAMDPWAALAHCDPTSTVLLSLGPHLRLGAVAAQWASASGAVHVTVQHGLLTPDAPPLVSGTTLLAWSVADGEFWRSGRTDVTTQVVGSPMLWVAAQHEAVQVESRARPVYLGQLHGAELPRASMATSAEAFCLAHGASYRPHPAETDRKSRSFHRRLERRGIEVERSGLPLPALQRPVVSAFSTGVLEAAARGLPSWVDFVDPPAWLIAFWDRYGMSRWGGPATPAFDQPCTDPRLAIADALQAMMSS